MENRFGMGSSQPLPDKKNKLELSKVRRRGALVFSGLFLAFSSVGAQLFHLANKSQERTITTVIHAPLATNFARPDIVDRNGRLLATDVAMPSLFADPARVLDRHLIADALKEFHLDIDGVALSKSLRDKRRRFLWIKRHLPPGLAQKIHNLGLPGLSFRDEINRIYPRVKLAGHVLGHVDIDNKGLAGFERYIDTQGWVKPVSGVERTDRTPVQVSLDLAVQQALTYELEAAQQLYKAKAAAGLVMDVRTGEVVAASSLPGIDPAYPVAAARPMQRDRVAASTFELGSIFKAFTVAMALDSGQVTPTTKVDVSGSLRVGNHAIADPFPSNRPLTVAEVFLKSSNVGAGALALTIGKNAQQEFLSRIGLLKPLATETGPVAPVQAPKVWGDAETVTVSYGHGLAVAPMQFAAAAASLINGGRFVRPTFLRKDPSHYIKGAQVIKTRTSFQMRDLMLRNVRDKIGTGRLARVPGYRVGGKTGTAELATKGGYNKKAVISSFVGAFPMNDPAYLTLVCLFEPQPVAAAGGKVSAGRNAAPTTARLVKRIAPLLGVRAQR